MRIDSLVNALKANDNIAAIWHVPPAETQALYKLYRLGGYGVASDLAAFGAGNDDIGSLSSSAAALSVAGHQDEMGRARFVAFGLHSLTGEWIDELLSEGRITWFNQLIYQVFVYLVNCLASYLIDCLTHFVVNNLIHFVINNLIHFVINYLVNYSMNG